MLNTRIVVEPEVQEHSLCHGLRGH
jgi:hypothetical protein